VRHDRVRLHVCPSDRVWLRDSAPIGVVDEAGAVVWLDWGFNAWAKYPNWQLDANIGPVVARLSGRPREVPLRSDTREPIVLEGGGIEVNGDGLLLVTEEWLLSDVQVRNPGLTRVDYERIFAEWLGIRRTIWLGEGCVGDDTHGHIDDVARFVGRETVVLAVEEDPADENHARSVDNLRDAALPHAAGACCIYGSMMYEVVIDLIMCGRSSDHHLFTGASGSTSRRCGWIAASWLPMIR
jgi:agmatine deiminase